MENRKRIVCGGEMWTRIRKDEVGVCTNSTKFSYSSLVRIFLEDVNSQNGRYDEAAVVA
jgi:hypothetical protein